MQAAINILKKRLESLTKMEDFTRKNKGQSFCTLEEIYKERKEIVEALKKIQGGNQ